MKAKRWISLLLAVSMMLGVARHSETEEEMVVYRALYGEGGLWVRPAAMWLETVTRDGVTQPRFTYIGE